ncbi:MAG: 23S rRNA (adenine(2503)-C(2))-methyltransferase RlmN [Pseudomonadota bacterium]
MEILSLRLNQITDEFKSRYDKGVYHASALYREVYKFGRTNLFEAKEFKNSPVFAKQLKNKIKVTPGQVIEIIKDGSLTKFITRLADNLRIESVIIPMTNHQTLCVSSQVGCRMGCRFCQTAKMGFKRNLEVYEIIGQLFNARFVLKADIKNIVFMGMGEPFDNFETIIQAIRIMNEQKGFNIGLKHITVSTAGVNKRIDQLGKLNMPGIRLAISINSVDEIQRSCLMPVNKTNSLKDLKQVLLKFPLSKRDCFLFEYILIKGLNDSIKDAIDLAEYIKPLPVRLNLIPYNRICGFDYESPNDKEIRYFADILNDNGIFVITRWSKGRSVSAGCGQLGRPNTDSDMTTKGHRTS